MKTEQELKADCTPEIIKKMVELAEGFDKWELREIYDPEIWTKSDLLFPLLIHRAVEGWNKRKISGVRLFELACIEFRKELPSKYYYFKDYLPQSLTLGECAGLHCLIERFKEEIK